MNENEQSAETDINKRNSDQTPVQNTGRGSGRVVAWLALLLATAIGGVGYYIYQQKIIPLRDLPNQILKIQDSGKTSLDQLAGDFSSKITALSNRLSVLEQTQTLDQERFHRIEQDFAILRGQAYWTNREWVLAEIKHLVAMANDRLRFANDTATAQKALQAALGRLGELNDPSLEPLRQRLQADLQQLVLQAESDSFDGQVATLNQLITSIAPFPRDPVPVELEEAENAQSQVDVSPTTGSKSQLPGSDSLKQWFTGLTNRIRIIQHDAPLNAQIGYRIAPYQLALLKLKVEALRLALLQRNQRFFQYELDSIRLWLQNNSIGELGSEIDQALVQLQESSPFKKQLDLQPALDMITALTKLQVPHSVRNDRTEIAQ